MRKPRDRNGEEKPRRERRNGMGKGGRGRGKGRVAHAHLAIRCATVGAERLQWPTAVRTHKALGMPLLVQGSNRVPCETSQHSPTPPKGQVNYNTHRSAYAQNNKHNLHAKAHHRHRGRKGEGEREYVLSKQPYNA